MFIIVFAVSRSRAGLTNLKKRRFDPTNIASCNEDIRIYI
jgi:hypothetical protein